MRRYTCAIDLDNVIADTQPVLHRLWRSLSTDHWIPTEYDPPGGYRSTLFITVLHHLYTHLDTLPIMPGARTTLRYLSHWYRIVIVTARPIETRSLTSAWLHRRRIPFDALHHVVVKGQLGEPLRFAVDDLLGHAVEYATHGVPCFLLDQAWNRHVPLPSGITRVPHWEAILEHLSGRSPYHPSVITPPHRS